MATADVKIKVEPFDDDFFAIKEEELIIKSEIDDESSCNQTEVSESEMQSNFDLLIPKDEPMDEEYLFEDNSVIEQDNKKPESPSPKFECVRCKRQFTSARGLSSHKRLRCRNINVCTVCGQVFRSLVILQDHLQQHKTPRKSPNKERKTPSPPERILPHCKLMRFTCTICNMSFRNSQSLRNHERIHDGNNYNCSQCGKSFKYLANLRKHANCGMPCVRETEDVLPDSNTDIKIKEEVESDDDTEGDELTQEMLRGATVVANVDHTNEHNVIVDGDGNTFTIKKENFITVPTVPIKEEPVDIQEEQTSNSMDYEELILQELIDRKAKSIAKERKVINGSTASLENKDFNRLIKKENLNADSPSIRNEDSEDITSNRLTITVDEDAMECQVKKQQIPDASAMAASMQSYDFEKMIDCNMLPNFQAKKKAIESLKEEYQKAKKKKLDEVLSDKGSQNSLSAAEAVDAVPCSKYFSLKQDIDSYNNALRELDKKYRYTWVCSWCPRRYVQRYAFIKHLSSIHCKQKSELNDVLFELRPEAFVPTAAENTHCHLCRVILADATSLQKHRDEFHKEDNSVKLQFQCDKCGKYCSTRTTLANHLLANCGTEPQYGCDVCGKKFHTKSTLNLHKTMHTGELPHKCGYCEKRFRTRGQLTVHTRTHTGERPFPCKVCERRFTHRETLIAHLSRHIDMKRYKCYGCDKFFSCISGLKTHRLTRMNSCGLIELNARPLGPRVRVIKGNVIFEPRPKINPYQRHKAENFDENTAENENLHEDEQNQNVNDILKV